MARSYDAWAADQPRPGRQLAGWSGVGNGRVLVGDSAWRPDGGGADRRCGAVKGWRQDLVANRTSHHVDQDSSGGFCSGWDIVAGGAGRGLLLEGPGQNLALDLAASISGDRKSTRLNSS